MTAEIFKVFVRRQLRGEGGSDARPQVSVTLLHTAIFFPALCPGSGIGFGDAPGAEVAGANPADFSFADELVKSFQRLFKRGISVIVMGIIQVDGLGLQTPQ